MFKLSKFVEYSLMALNHLHQMRPGELITARELADTYSISFDVTSRVMQRMKKHKLLQSQQGVSGGYQLIKDLSKISFLQLMVIVDGDVGLTSCTADGICALSDNCSIMSPIDKLNKKFLDFCDSLSVKDIIEENFQTDSERLQKTPMKIVEPA